VRLVLIGLAGGLFSALFGVGGGLIIVPLLILAASFGTREATATSLAAVVVVAAAGTIAYSLLDRVHLAPALLVGLPAVLGAVAGARLQQRVPQRPLSLAFAALLVVVAALRLAA
jgi:uncharacterized membrane protein YfcA